MASGVAAFVAKVQRTQETIPAAMRAGASEAGKQVKAAWLGVAGANGMNPGGKIAKRAWGVNYTVEGGAAATTVQFTGPAHLVIFPNQRHFIGARRLGTRGALAKKSAGVGAVSAFGGSNRGAFGQLRAASRTTKSGNVVSNGAQALTIGGQFRAYAFHPGTRGKRAIWEESKAAAQRIGPAVYSVQYRKSLIDAGLGAGSSTLGALL